MDFARFQKKPFMGILRGVDEKVVEPLVEAVVDSGLQTIEIAMNSAHAAAVIRLARRVSGNRLMIGAGTVCSKQTLQEALDAGATFIVLPVLVAEVVEYCAARKIPVFPGALTPQEIYRAWNAGAAMVKVFPAKMFGPAYFKEVKAPFNQLKLLACGGVTPENKNEYFSQGADALAFGGSIFKKELMREGKFLSITQRIKEYLN